jgi:hypothetical protein
MNAPQLVSIAGAEYVWKVYLTYWEENPEELPAAKLIEEAKTLIKSSDLGAWGKAALERLEQIEPPPPPERDEIHDIIGYDE